MPASREPPQIVTNAPLPPASPLIPRSPTECAPSIDRSVRRAPVAQFQTGSPSGSSSSSTSWLGLPAPIVQTHGGWQPSRVTVSEATSPHPLHCTLSRARLLLFDRRRRLRCERACSPAPARGHLAPTLVDLMSKILDQSSTLSSTLSPPSPRPLSTEPSRAMRPPSLGPYAAISPCPCVRATPPSNGPYQHSETFQHHNVWRGLLHQAAPSPLGRMSQVHA